MRFLSSTLDVVKICLREQYWFLQLVDVMKSILLCSTLLAKKRETLNCFMQRQRRPTKRRVDGG